MRKAAQPAQTKKKGVFLLETSFQLSCTLMELAANKLGTCTLFALFNDSPVSTIANMRKWKYLSSGKPVNNESNKEGSLSEEDNKSEEENTYSKPGSDTA